MVGAKGWSVVRAFFGTADRASGMILVLFGIAVLWESRAFPLGTLGRPGPAFLPVVLAGVVVGLAVLVLVFGRRSPQLRSLERSEGGRVGAILSACALAALALERLGYRLTMIVVLAFLLGAVERSRPAVTISIAAGFALASYWVFQRLGVLLPEGPFGF